MIDYLGADSPHSDPLFVCEDLGYSGGFAYGHEFGTNSWWVQSSNSSDDDFTLDWVDGDNPFTSCRWVTSGILPGVDSSIAGGQDGTCGVTLGGTTLCRLETVTAPTAIITPYPCPTYEAGNSIQLYLIQPDYPDCSAYIAMPFDTRVFVQFGIDDAVSNADLISRDYVCEGQTGDNFNNHISGKMLAAKMYLEDPTLGESVICDGSSSSETDGRVEVEAWQRWSYQRWVSQTIEIPPGSKGQFNLDLRVSSVSTTGYESVILPIKVMVRSTNTGSPWYTQDLTPTGPGLYSLKFDVFFNRPA